MFTLIKMIVWTVGVVTICVFVVRFMGYELNTDYFHESKAACMERLKACREEYVHQGLDNAQCSFDCVERNIWIKTSDKKNTSDNTPLKNENESSNQENTPLTETEKNTERATDTAEETEKDDAQ